MRQRAVTLLSAALLFLTACAPALTLTPPSATAQPATPAPLSSPTGTASPTASPSPAFTPTLPAPAPTRSISVCSPLEGISLSELSQPDLLKNPFQLSRPGMDDGHFGADFAYWSRGERKQMLGHPVLSALDGRIAGVILNRQPYGNAVIIETPLEAVPASWQPLLPTPAPTVQPAPNLNCPPDLAPYAQGEYARNTGRSLYLLYAHLNQPPEVSKEQKVACGQVIGEVGTTGRSVNYHLHLETRVGPAGITFPEMAHYDNAATAGEMATYCTWRVSGLFQAFDPLAVLSLQP